MPDREKVIGLLQEMADYFRECRSNASFASKAETHFWELQNAANEAVELLKGQEARVLDWDEIKNYPVVYGEFKGVRNIFPLIITVDDGRCLSWNPSINTSEEFILLVDNEDDRKNTRCWNKMPTEEQRQAVKWG